MPTYNIVPTKILDIPASLYIWKKMDLWIKSFEYLIERNNETIDRKHKGQA